MTSKTEAETNVASQLRALAAATEARGYVYSLGDLANFYLALRASPLVIITGTPGMGRSRLPRLFAELTESRFQHISVKPHWGDNSYLLGYTTRSGEQFVEGEILQSIRAARDTGDLTVALLDEMNLAAVEHYFSDFLSVAETRRRSDSGEIATDPLPLDLPAPPDDGTDDSYADLRELRLPPSLRVVGTANMDETTRLFSPKVLDRAFSIEFGDVDLTVFAETADPGADADADFSELARRVRDTSVAFVSEAYTSSGEVEALFDRAAELLEAFKQKLHPAASFGYRTRNQVLMYLYHWHTDGLADVLDLDAAFDLCLLQKVLPKIGGTSAALRDVLGGAEDGAQAWLEAEHSEPAGNESENATGLTGPFLRSAEKVERMIRQLETEGATSFWTA